MSVVTHIDGTEGVVLERSDDGYIVVQTSVGKWFWHTSNLKEEAVSELIRCGECDTPMLEDEVDPLSDWLNYKCPNCGNCLSMPPWVFDDPDHYDDDFEPEPPMIYTEDEHNDFYGSSDISWVWGEGVDDEGRTSEDIGY